MVRYVDYVYYHENFGGTVIKEDDFFRISRDASAFIREITHGLVNEETESEEVKDATCAVCEVLWNEEKCGGREIKSAETDGESVSYVTEGKDGQLREKLLWQKQYYAARKYLIHTGLLYLGV